jgi:hypothetical protein
MPRRQNPRAQGLEAADEYCVLMPSDTKVPSTVLRFSAAIPQNAANLENLRE